MSASIILSPNLGAGQEACVIRLYSKLPMPFARGGLAKAAEAARSAGRAGDDVLLHITPQEFDVLKAHWGEPSTNPHTGLPEYGFFSKIKKALKFEKFNISNIVKTIAKNPQRLLVGGVDPLGTKIANAALGTQWRPVVNQLGGATKETFQQAKNKGLDIGLAKDLHNVAGTIAGFYGGSALGALGSEGLGAASQALAATGSGTASAVANTLPAIGSAVKTALPVIAAGSGMTPPNSTEQMPFDPGPGVAIPTNTSNRRYIPYEGDFMSYAMGPQATFYQGAANGGHIVRSPQLADGGDVRIVRLYAKPSPTQFSRGGLARAAERTRRAGRGEDEVLLHITKEEFEHLKRMWGEPDINPLTGLPEYGFLSKLWKGVKKVVKKVAPYAGIIASVFMPALAPAIGAAMGASGAAATALGGAVINGASGAITGGGKGALAGAITGGLGGSAGKIGGALGLSGNAAKLAGNALISGTGTKIQGGDFGQGALSGALTSAITPSIEGAVGNAKNALPSNPLSKAMAGLNTKLGNYATAQGAPVGMPAAPTGQAAPVAAPGAAPVMGMGGDDVVPMDAGMAPGAPAAPAAAAPAAGPTDLMSLAKKYWPLALAGTMLGSKGEAKAATPPELSSQWTAHLPQLDFNRQAGMPMQDWYTYGMRPEGSFYQDNNIPDFTPGEDPKPKARGGALFGRGFVDGPGTGRSDSIPAQLSDGEYVLTAEDVALIGDGSSKAGAQRLDQWRESLRKHKGKALARGKISPNAKNPAAYLKA